MEPMWRSVSRVGDDNIFIYLVRPQITVIHRYEAADYRAKQWYEGDPNIRRQ